MGPQAVTAAPPRSKLFTPGLIGGVEVPNRVVMPSMTTRLADAEGHVTDATIAYFAARARGGVGLITVEMAAPEKAGKHRHNELGICHDRFLPGLARLVAALHDAGSKVSIQLGHGGGHTRKDISGEEPIAPSAIEHSVFEATHAVVVPREMSRARIARTVQAHVAAARRAREAGFDAIELHAAHGYLISQFLCPAENRRTDAYGGTLENRARFGLDILRRIKAEVPGLAVIFRMNADDFMANGMPFAEARRVAKWAAEAGADALHVSGGHYRSWPQREIMVPPMAYPEATFLDYAARVKAEASVPVIAVGRLGDPATAMAAVDSGKADFVALGRALLADPDWVSKVRAGRAVRRCLACNTCINEMRGGATISCLVNPVTGRELEFAAPRPPKDEAVCVVGAGPAGLCYAYHAADHNAVTVFERAAGPGGAFNHAGKAPRFQEVEAREAPLRAFVAELERGCREKGVAFHYNVDVTREAGRLDPFERVVFATGAAYRYGLGALVPRLLEAGWGRSAPVRRAFAAPSMRDWFYYRARRATGTELAGLARPGQKVLVIGDAARVGKGREAIADAVRAALFDPLARRPEARPGPARASAVRRSGTRRSGLRQGMERQE
ncbi:MAG: NAD(P)-binding protein [Kiloniellaceae bacterium]